MIPAARVHWAGRTRERRRRIGAHALACTGLWLCLAAPADADERANAADPKQAARDRLVVESLTRLERFDVSGNAKLKGSVLRHARTLRGTDDHLDLVRRFNLAEEVEAIVGGLAAEPSGGFAANAAKLVLDLGGAERLGTALAHPDTPPENVAALAATLGLTRDERAAPLLVDLLGNPFPDSAIQPPPAVQEAAIVALAQTARGAEVLIGRANNGLLPGDLKKTAAAALTTSPDPAVRERAAEAFAGTGAGSPAGRKIDVAALLRQKGDIANGKRAYQNVCAVCHRAGDIGIDFGPALTEIGNKLPKSELYTAILQPNAGISFDYVGHSLTLEGGGSAGGIIESETDESITLKLVGGVKQTIPKHQVIKREPIKLSLMPEGLHLALSDQELVDLVEFLATLKP